jgi:Flp pilus assembly pilin Flp
MCSILGRPARRAQGLVPIHFINREEDVGPSSLKLAGMKNIRRLLAPFLTAARRDDRGFSLVEYSILTAGIAVVVIAGVAVLAASVTALFDPLPF